MGFKYRYESVCGLEFCKPYSDYWYPVTGEMLLAMTASELRCIADVMESALNGEDGE